MPNHVRNVLKIKTQDIDELMNRITSPRSDTAIFPLDYIIDFDKIIPEPRKLEDCSPKYIIPEEKRGHSGLEITDDRDWFNWLDWRVDNWGTKWGAYDCYCIIKRSYVLFIFSTAWSIPQPIYQKLGKMGYEMEIRYADEDLGSNCGKLFHTKDGGWWREEPKNPRRYASELWSQY